MELLSVEQSAKRLGISPSRLRLLIAQDRIRAQKVGRSWVLDLSDVESFALVTRKPGRPWHR